MSFFAALRRLFGRPTTGRGRPSAAPGRRWRRPAFEELEDRLLLTGDLLVSNFWSSNVLAFDGSTGAAHGVFASGNGLQSPVGIAIGPDNNVYVSSRDGNAVLRFNGQTGAFIDDFIAPGAGGLYGPHDLAFDGNGHLIVNSGFNSRLLEYNAGNGAFQNTIAAPGSSPLSFPHGLAVGPDGDFYVGDRNGNDVLRYDGATGKFLGYFVGPGSGGLNITTGVTFGPDGNLYVDGFNNNAVLRYDGHTGAFLGVFASGGGLSGPQGLAFGPDGSLYVSSFNTNQVLRYDGHTGAFLGVFAAGLSGPTYLTFKHTDTTTTVTSSAAAPVWGQPVTFTATVSSTTAGLVTPTGSVTFSVDGVAQANVALAGGQASFTAANLGVGTHTVAAVYSGDHYYNPSTLASFSQTVNKVDTAVTINAPSGVVFGEPVQLTVTVAGTTPSPGTPTGTISLTVDGAAAGTFTLSGGQVSFAIPPLSVGAHSLLAVYSGDANFNAGDSSDPVEWVKPAATTTTVAASVNSPVAGQPVTFTANVSVNAPGSGTPTGTVTFQDGTTVLGSASLQGGSASFTAALSAGSHTITASYGGDGNFAASPSSGLNEVVSQAASSVSLAASGNPVVLGQPVTLTAVVAAVAPGSGTPTGTVTFSDGSAVLGTATLQNGVASFTTSALGVGGHTLTAAYGGDANFSSGSSAGLGETVNRIDTSVAVVSSANPAAFGQPVSLTVSVAGVSAGPGAPTGSVAVTVDGSALGSFTLANGQVSFSLPALAVGGHTVVASYGGDGSYNAGTSAGFTETVQAAATSTALTASAGPAVFGQPVTLTAAVTVNAPGAGAPSGSVTFLDGTTVLGTAAVQNGAASLTTAGFGVGSHSLTAAYGGDGSFSGSSSAALSLAVNPADTAVTVASSASPAAYGQPVTLTVTVGAQAPGQGTPTGSVAVTVDGAALGTFALSNGQASFSPGTLAAGSHTVVVTYGGDGNFNAGGTASFTQAVVAAGTSTSVVSSAASAVYGQPVTFTATVSAVAPGSGTPSGTVTFLDGTAVLGTATLQNGSASFTTSALGVGGHTVTASYAGDGNFAASASAGLGQPVQQAATGTSLTASATTVLFGQSVSFTATVAAQAPGQGTATGSIQFMDGTTVLATVALQNGVASFTTSALGAGSHTITACYVGDANFTGSTSAAVTETVTQVDTSTALASSVSPAVFSQAVTFTVSVGSSVPGSGTPTGSVSVSVDGAAAGSYALSNGQASFSLSSLAVGSHTVVASYTGDGEYKGSTSAALTQAVVADGTTTTVVSSAASAVYGQAVTFTATVAADAPGAGTPTGTVSFYDGSTLLGTGTLQNGVATFTTSTLAVQGHTITAGYGGDAGFTGSTSAAVSQSVGKDASVVAVTASANPAVVGKPVTFTATVAAAAPGGGTPTGTVTFIIDGRAQRPVGLVGGQAALTVSRLRVGSHTVSVVYSGDGNFLKGTSPKLTLTVIKKPSVKITSPGNGSTVGRYTTLTGWLSSAAPVWPVVVVHPLQRGEPWYVQPVVQSVAANGTFSDAIYVGNGQTPKGLGFVIEVFLVASQQQAAQLYPEGAILKSPPTGLAATFIFVTRS